MMKVFVEDVAEEARNVKTVYFRWDREVKPGQFVMVWLPGYGEIPMSLSHIGSRKGITVKAYGTVSQRMIELHKGEEFYIRGPYGNGFNVVSGRKLIVGGGSGMASLLPIADSETYALISARTKEDLIFVDRFPEERRIVLTDDGSLGNRGYPHEFLETMDLEGFREIYVCGPEPMLYQVMKVLIKRKRNAQFSLERTMKCGIGICDSCSVGGLQVCKDGPVFDIDTLSSNEEFGRYRLSYSGRRIASGTK